MNRNVKRFIELVKLHPELPVIPMVETEVIPSDEFSSWIAGFGKSEVKEFVFYEMYYDCPQIIFKENQYEIIEDLVEKNDDMSEEEAKKIVDDMDWQKAIILDIGLPDYM